MLAIAPNQTNIMVQTKRKFICLLREIQSKNSPSFSEQFPSEPWFIVLGPSILYLGHLIFNANLLLSPDGDSLDAQRKIMAGLVEDFYK